ncbi:hypothetical protein ABTF58_15025 [Acinetobacter baumannii]
MNYSNNLSNNTMYESGNHKKIITKYEIETIKTVWQTDKIQSFLKDYLNTDVVSITDPTVIEQKIGEESLKQIVSIWLIEYNHSSALSPHGLFSPISSVDFVESFFCSRLS